MSDFELDDDIDAEESPFCECGEDPMEDELGSGVCSSCGKLLP
jgi:hypothetical protein